MVGRQEQDREFAGAGQSRTERLQEQDRGTQQTACKQLLPAAADRCSPLGAVHDAKLALAQLLHYLQG